MAQEVILYDDIIGLGTVGDRVTVADGYARNYLLPRKKAVRATAANLREVEARKRKLEEEYRERLSAAQSLAERVQDSSVTLMVQATEEDRLYGSVTARDIADGLQKEGVEVEPDTVLLHEPIRELGVYNVQLQLHPEVATSVNVWVVRAEEGTAESSENS